MTVEPDPRFLAEPPPPPDLRLHYGPAAAQVAELRLPGRTLTRAPVVVMLHGGFWRSRYDAAHLGHAATALTRSGFATWNVEYRRVGDPDGGWPSTFTDVARGIAYLERVAEDTPIDLSRVAIVGHSAGGHLALWSAAAHRTARVAAWSTSWSPRGLIGLAAVSNLGLAHELDLSDGAVAGLLGRTTVHELLPVTSPSELLPLGIPQVLIHGDRDRVVPPSMSSGYVTRAVAAGDDAHLIGIPDCGHFEVIDPTSRAWHIVRETICQVLEPVAGTLG